MAQRRAPASLNLPAPSPITLPANGVAANISTDQGGAASCTGVTQAQCTCGTTRGLSSARTQKSQAPPKDEENRRPQYRPFSDRPKGRLEPTPVITRRRWRSARERTLRTAASSRDRPGRALRSDVSDGSLSAGRSFPESRHSPMSASGRGANDRLWRESRPPHLRHARRPEADAPTDRRGSCAAGSPGRETGPRRLGRG
jgi:hypothetical protein